MLTAGEEKPSRLLPSGELCILQYQSASQDVPSDAPNVTYVIGGGGAVQLTKNFVFLGFNVCSIGRNSCLKL